MRLKATIGVLSAAGGVGTHLLAYLFGEPSVALGSRLVLSVAHNHWNYVVAAAVAAFVYGITMFVSSRSTDRPDLTPRQIGRWAFVRLTVLHLSGFLILELLEVGFVGTDAHHLLLEGPVLIGICVAIALAAIIALTLQLVAATVDLVLKRTTRERPHRQVPTAHSLRDGDALVSVHGVAWGLRGPPLASTG